MTLWLRAVTPTRAPLRTSSQIIRGTGIGLACTRGALNSESRVVELRSNAYRELGRSLSLTHLERT